MMTPVARRIFSAALALALLSLGLLGVMLSTPVAGIGGLATAAGDRAGATATGTAEAPLLTEGQARTFVFFAQGRVASGGGPGLFQTDFFKPAPPPKAAPKPPPPTTREVALFYRGLASFPDGGRVAYLAVDGRTLLLDLGAAVIDGWTLAAFDGDGAALAKGEERLALPFNRRALLSVPVKP